jgi:hypothetical protein
MIIARCIDDALKEGSDAAARRNVFSAKSAAFIRSLGQRPRPNRRWKPSALKARINRALSRAFSARSLCNVMSWGVAPDCHESAPSALDIYARAIVLGVSSQ